MQAQALIRAENRFQMHPNRPPRTPGLGSLLNKDVLTILVGSCTESTHKERNMNGLFSPRPRSFRLPLFYPDSRLTVEIAIMRIKSRRHNSIDVALEWAGQQGQAWGV